MGEIARREAQTVVEYLWPLHVGTALAASLRTITINTTKKIEVRIYSATILWDPSAFVRRFFICFMLCEGHTRRVHTQITKVQQTRTLL